MVVCRLEPVKWKNGWPEMGEDIDNDGIGEPVSEWKKPDVGKTYPISIPQTSDDFDTSKLGLQWQWHANPKNDWYSLVKNPGHLRLYSIQNLTQSGNLWFVPNLLLQKFPAPSFTVTTKITFNPDQLNEKSGLVIMGKEWAFIAFTKTNQGLQIGMYTGAYERSYDKTQKIDSVNTKLNTCFFKVQVDSGGVCNFFYSYNNKDFKPIGKEFKASPGMWIGAKVGLFNENPNIIESKGYSDFDWFKLE
jgi:beta-xylosidase